MQKESKSVGLEADSRGSLLHTRRIGLTNPFVCFISPDLQEEELLFDNLKNIKVFLGQKRVTLDLNFFLQDRFNFTND